MEGPPAGLRFALEHGIPAEIDVVGASMEPAIAKGTKVHVERLAPGALLTPGDLVVLETEDRAVLLLHRVIHVFSEGGDGFVIHQGDAPSSRFGTCRREDVVARAAAVVGEDPQLPTLNRLNHDELTRFQRRRVAGQAFALARGLTFVFGLRGSAMARRCGQLYRSVASRLTG